MAQKIYRGGVFGFGEMGQKFTSWINCVRWFGEDVKIIGVCNRGEEKRQLAVERFGIKAFKDPRDLIKEGLDFAIVTSSTSAHLEHGCLLAEAGVPMMMEKPIALNYADGKTLCETVKKHNVETTVNFDRRFQPYAQKMKEIIDSGTIGRVVSFEGCIYRGHGIYEGGARHVAIMHPEETGTWIVHHACHTVDVACWFCGEVDEVSVITQSTVPDRFAPEFVRGFLFFKSGAVGYVFDTVGGVKSETTAVVGTKGGIALREGAGTNLINIRVKGDPEPGAPRCIEPRDTYKYIDPINTIIQIARGQTKSKTTVHDALYTLKVTLAMEQSALKNGQRVKVDSIQ
jgi:predicted dehydrogenase